MPRCAACASTASRNARASASSTSFAGGGEGVLPLGLGDDGISLCLIESCLGCCCIKLEHSAIEHHKWCLCGDTVAGIDHHVSHFATSGEAKIGALEG